MQDTTPNDVTTDDVTSDDVIALEHAENLVLSNKGSDVHLIWDCVFSAVSLILYPSWKERPKDILEVLSKNVIEKKSENSDVTPKQPLSGDVNESGNESGNESSGVVSCVSGVSGVSEKRGSLMKEKVGAIEIRLMRIETHKTQESNDKKNVNFCISEIHLNGIQSVSSGEAVCTPLLRQPFGLKVCLDV